MIPLLYATENCYGQRMSTLWDDLVTSADYLRRKKILPTPEVRPRYTMGDLHSHRRPVSLPAELANVDSPDRVITESWPPGSAG